MSIPDDLLLPNYEGDLRFWTREIRRVIREVWTHTAKKMNALANGRIAACYSTSAPPTSGQWIQGDMVRNNAPTELGTAGSKYVVYGWLCVQSGEPGLWAECRFLTGN